MGKGVGKGEGRGGFLGMLWNLERRICGCLCCLLCTGPILMIVGVIFLVSTATDTRGALVTEYNTAVNAWTNNYRAIFAQANFNFKNNTSPAYPLHPDTTADSLNDHGSDLHSYSALKYWNTLNLVISPTPWQPGASYSISFQAGTSTFTGSGVSMKQQVYSQTDLQCSTTTSTTTSSSPTTDCRTACSQKGGTWNSITYQCTVNYYLSQYCAKVDGTANGTTGNWWLSSAYGGIGCDYSNNWDPSYYSSIISPSTIYYNGNAVIRSVNDPYIVASHLTSGTLYFGLSTADKAKIGISLLIAGGVFMAPVILITYCVVKHFQKKHGSEYSSVVQQPYRY